eukprot:TRINITY_DN3982_c0_g2_i11.p1 TRINITY_DN3982_c0_g2~~TRINITY_DN3982_c0_g2_i11.p1  ORF type:complete len:175 (+),score=19.46 TRINITY_DN3982_c0_g2_i11:216-740(+)
MRNQVMEVQAKFQACFACALSAISFNLFGIIYSARVRSTASGPFEKWIDSLACNKVLYIFSMIYYILGILTCFSFNLLSIFRPEEVVHMAWYIPLYILSICTIAFLYSAQSAHTKIYPESACLVKEEPTTDGTHKGYGNQMACQAPGPCIGPSKVLTYAQPTGTPGPYKPPLIQ